MNNKKIVLNILFDKDWFMEQYNEEYNMEEDVEIPSEEETPSDDNLDKNIEEEKEEDASIDNVVKDNVKEEVKAHTIDIDGTTYDKDTILELANNSSQKDEEINSLKVELENANKAVEFYNYLQANPHIVDAMMKFDNPQIAKEFSENYPKLPSEQDKHLETLENRLAELELKNTLHELHKKYEDFNDDEVLQYAVDKNIIDLDIAYKALKSEKSKEVKPDMEALRSQIRQEILEEIKKDNENTKSLISSKGNQAPEVKQYNLSAIEKKMALEFGMTEEEYYNFSKM